MADTTSSFSRATAALSERWYLQPQGCYVPPQHGHLKWHVRRADYGYGDEPHWVYERAEWVSDNGSGSPIWIRWGYCGDFASLSRGEYVGPALDQETPYVEDRGR